MISGLKPYPDYVESGLPWLGEVPSHWGTERAKWLFNKMNRIVRPEDDIVTCFRDGVVTLRRKRRVSGFTEALHEHGYQGIRRGDLVIHAMDAFAGAIGVSDSDGKGTPVYAVCQPKAGVNAHYYAFILREMSRRRWILALSRGIRERSTDFRYEMFGTQRIPLPPPDEQTAIVRFLDYVNGRLEKAIRAKRKVIGLLNEQKQAIIHRAVTRGLDPNVRLKDSGIPWLGEIPEHWGVHALKQLVMRMDYGTSENSRGKGRVRVLTMGHIRDGKILLPSFGSLSEVPPGLLLETNDLLFNRTNSPDLVGKVGLFAGQPSDEVTFASYLVRLRARPEHSPHWLNFLLNSIQFWGYARSQALVSLHQANLNSTRYGQMMLPTPPKIEEEGIVKHIVTECDGIERCSRRTHREIALLSEFRTRLIADVVTGKLDVREAAGTLPDELTKDIDGRNSSVSGDEDLEDEEADET
jgi:type I restriction enzyme S subunit